MRFSVLLPTRNGGRFLRDCISSILDEDFADLELIVSDNANTDETQDVLASFKSDPRIRILRLEKPVSVTDNWNRAFQACTGDYFLMMGDDDCLLPGYFKRMDEVLKKYGDPDCVTYNAYTYITPESINNNKQSYYNPVHFSFGPDFGVEGFLSRGKRFSIARDMFRFRVRIPLNMQTTLVSRKSALGIQGGVFQPPFPDHYALNALLLTARQWLYLPEKLLIVGVSPKSFGHFVYSNQQEKGLDYLGIGSTFKGKLPGNELINNMYIWLSLLKKTYRDRLSGVEISRPEYVKRQVYYWYMQYKFKAISLSGFKARLSRLTAGDVLGLFGAVIDGESWTRLWRMLKSRRKSNLQKIMHGLSPIDDVRNIGDFRDWIAKK